MWRRYINQSAFKRIEQNEPIDDIDLDTIRADVLRMYSMESFVYRLMFDAARRKDKSKVKTLGPYACLLQLILLRYDIDPRKQYLFQERCPGRVMYRGLQADAHWVYKLKEMAPPNHWCTTPIKCLGNMAYHQITLCGFTSIHQNEEQALKMAFPVQLEAPKGTVPVLYKFVF